MTVNYQATERTSATNPPNLLGNRPHKIMTSLYGYPFVIPREGFEPSAILFLGGTEDLKGHVLKLRGDLMKNNRHCELEALSIHVIIEQAAHELKYGDARVRTGRLWALESLAIITLPIKGRMT